MKRSVGALLSCASSTRRTTRAMVLSCAAAVTRTRIAPSPLIVPAKTSSSGPLRLGVLSPVTGASSMALSPETIAPSAGTRSPGRTRITDPTARLSAGTSRGSPPLSSRAVFGHEIGKLPDACARPARGDALQKFADEEQEDDRRCLFGCADDHGPDGGYGHQHLDRERRAEPRRDNGAAGDRNKADRHGRKKCPGRRDGTSRPMTNAATSATPQAMVRSPRGLFHNGPSSSAWS